MILSKLSNNMFEAYNTTHPIRQKDESTLGTIHEPTRSWHNISWSTSASKSTNYTHKLH